MIAEKDIKRFEKFFIKNDDCWLWKGGISRNYGHFTYRGKTIKAHRFSYKLYKGNVPNELFVCHKCDTPACVNPKHLFLGTAKDNMQDCKKKGRNVLSEGARKKISLSLIGNKRTLGKNLGNKHTLGHKLSEEHKRKISISLVGNKYAAGNKNWLGKEHSEETKQKLRIAKLGKKMSAEARKKMSESQRLRRKKHLEKVL